MGEHAMASANQVGTHICNRMQAIAVRHVAVVDGQIDVKEFVRGRRHAVIDIAFQINDDCDIQIVHRPPIKDDATDVKHARVVDLCDVIKHAKSIGKGEMP